MVQSSAGAGRNKGRWRYLALAAALLSGCAMPQAPTLPAAAPVQENPLEREAARLYDIGKAHLAAGRLGLAANSLQAARAANPASLEILNALAAAYDRLGRFDLADRYYGEALAIDGRDLQTLNNFGYSQLMRGNLKRAALLFAMAKSLDPTDPIVAANLALAEAKVAATGSAADVAHDAPGGPAPPPSHAVPPGRSAQEQQAPTTTQAPAVISSAVVAAQEQEQAAPPAVPVEPVEPVEQAALPAPGAMSAAEPVPAVRVEAAAEPAQPDPQQFLPVAAALSSTVHDPVLPSSSERFPACLLEVSNGAGRTRMAARFRHYLGSRGWSTQRLTNDASFGNPRTVIFYRDAAAATAARLAAEMPHEVALQASSDLACEVRVRLGRDLLGFDSSLIHRFALSANQEDRS